MHSRALTVREYLEELDGSRREAVQNVCEIIKRTAKDAEETMEHSMPFYKLNGKPFVAVASQKHYVSVYVVALDNILAENQTLADIFSTVNKGKNCLRFTPANLDAIPYDALEQVIRACYVRSAAAT